MHIADSYLELTIAPMTIRKFYDVIDVDNEIKQALDAASLYIITKREVPGISLLEELPEGIEKNDYVIPLEVSLKKTVQ